MLRVVLIDDERLARQGMRQLLAEFSSRVEVVGEAANATLGKVVIESEQPDAVFLDIQMPGIDGFELIRGITKMPRVVFVTAHSEHAVRAFDVQAIDYLLKPVMPERLEAAIRRLEGSDAERYYRDDRVCFRTPQRTLIASLRSIVALRADGDFTWIYVEGDAPIMIWQTLSWYEKMLPETPFTRLDRSLIVNLERVEKIEKLSRNESILTLRGCTESFSLGRVARGRIRGKMA